MPKRKSSRGKKLRSTNKRAKKQSGPFRLLDLPLEVVDCILEQATHLQYCLMNGSLDNCSFDDVMAEPISRSCHIIRNRVIGIIKARCVWVRVCCNVPQLRKVLFEKAASYVPSVSTKYRTFLELDTPTVDLFVGSSIVTAAAERAAESPQKSMLFPFSHRVWLALLQDIQHIVNRAADRSDASVKHIALRCNRTSALMEGILQSRLVPAFLALRDFTRVGFLGQTLSSALDDASTEQLEHMSIHPGFVRRMCAECTDLMDIYGRMRDLEDAGHREDSALIALYSYERLKMAMHQLRYPGSYNEPFEEDEHPFHHGIARLCIEIVERAYLALNVFYHTESIAWLRDHVGKSPWLRLGFIYDLEEAAFSLRVRERLRLHHILGRMHMMRARVDAGLEPGDTNEKLRVQDEAKYFSLVEEASLHEEIATRLEEIVESTTAKASKIRYQFLSEDNFIEIHNAEGTGYFWAGQESMLEYWGGGQTLRYLPIARDTAVAIGLPEDIEAGKFEPDVQYCGKSCNCIVF